MGPIRSTPCWRPGFPFALTLGQPDSEVAGDVNGDGVVNAVDVQLVINAALGVPASL